MDGRRWPKRDDYKRTQKKYPPRFCWQPAVPSWEKEFCKVVGCLDWDTLLQMKKVMQLHDNVIKWDDSAGEEAFSNAKKRFWAEKNGLPCDIPLPDPDAYIDRIDWDIPIDPALSLDLDVVPNEAESHNPVIIFGDALIANQEFSSGGWGDDEENFNVPADYSYGNRGDLWEQNVGNLYSNERVYGWSGFTVDRQWFWNGSCYQHMPWGSGWNGGWG